MGSNCRQWKEWHKKVKQAKIQAAIQAEIQTSDDTITFRKLVNEYIEQAKVSGRSDNHINSLAAVAEGIFFPQLGGGTPIQNFDYAKHILPFMKWLQDTPTAQGKTRSPVTCNKYGNYLKTFFNYAVLRGYIERNPMALWRKQYVPRKERLLSTEDLKKIIEHAAPHVQWAIEVAFNTGARTGESLNCCLSNGPT